MMIRLYPIAVLPLLALAACITEYSKTEAPAQLQVDGAETRFDLSFTPGSARLASGEAARLDRLVATGVIRPADRVTIAAAGTPSLAERRAAAISKELLAHGIVTDTATPQTVPSNHAILAIGRYAVTLPACPNWSQAPTYDFTNSVPSWYGCSSATNLGLMVASPADLVSGRALAPADAVITSNAVKLYLADKVKTPPAPTASPFAAPTGGETGGAPGGAPGAGAGAGTP
jgi:pilus assembly protein CpaD